MVRRLFSHTAIYGFAPQIPKVAGFLALPIITAHLTAFDFGVFGLITAVAGAVSVFANLGLNVVLSNSFYKSPMQYKWAWRQLYGFLITWNVPYAVLLAIVIWLFIPEQARHNQWLIVLLNAAPILLFGPTAMIGTLHLQLQQRPVPVVIRSVLIGFLSLGLNIFFIAHKGMGYMGWFFSSAISQIANQASYWHSLNVIQQIKPIFNFKRRFVRRQLIVSLPTVPHYYSSYLLNTADRVIMKLVGIPVQSIGLYNAANTVSSIALMFGNASGQAVSPLLLKAFKDNNELLARKLVFNLQIAFLVATFLASIWLKEIFVFLIHNATLRQVYPIGVILLMAYNYRPMYFGANARLFYFEKTKSLMKVTFAAGILTIVLNVLLLPTFGFKAAAWSTFIGFMFMGYSGFFLREFRERCNLSYYPLRWLSLTLSLTILAYWLVDSQVLIKALFSSLALASGLFALYKVNELD